MGKRSAVVELFLGDMGSMQRELRPSTQREDQLTMETKLEQIAVKAVNQLPKSVVREIRTPRSVGAGGGRPPPATRWEEPRGSPLSRFQAGGPCRLLADTVPDCFRRCRFRWQPAALTRPGQWRSCWPTSSEVWRKGAAQGRRGI